MNFFKGFKKTAYNPLQALRKGTFGRGLPTPKAPTSREIFGITPKAREAAKLTRGTKKIQQAAKDLAQKKDS